MLAPVFNLDNERVGEIDLPDDVFAVVPREDVLARVVHWQQARARSGNHQTKGISQVSGTTRKPFRQKGTGNARQGSLRSPQFRGGGIIFGPQTRDHGYSLPKKVRRLGLKCALSVKQFEGQIKVVDSFELKEPKTKILLDKLHHMGLRSALFIGGDTVDTNFELALRNMYNFDLLPQQGANVLSILKRDMLVLSRDAVHHLEARLK